MRCPWVARQTASDGTAITRAVSRLRRVVEQGDAEATLDLLVAAVPEFAASDEAWRWARRRSTPAVRRTGLARSA